MPQKLKKLYDPLTGGLLTEVNPLAFKETFTTDELNCIVTRKFGRSPRLGYETGDITPSFGNVIATSDTDFKTQPLDIASWPNPGNTPGKQFMVAQVQSGRINIFDVTDPFNPVFKKQFNDLVRRPGVINVTQRFKMFYGKGAFFVCSPEIEAFVIEFDYLKDTFTQTYLTFKVRDFDQFPPDEDFDAHPVNPSNKYIYNLKNQGWVPQNNQTGDPIDLYRQVTGTFPSLAEQWFVAKRPENDGREVQFNPDAMQSFYFGSSQAPSGHFIYDAFLFDRSQKVNDQTLPTEVKNKRMSSGTFGFGRAWWSDGELIYFSQTITDDVLKSQLCHQAGDPTAEFFSDIVDTDGGVISIVEANDIKALVTTRDSILAFAENGVWVITGGEGDLFKPANFRIYQASTIGIVSSHSYVKVDELPMWIAPNGIMTFKFDDVNQEYLPVNVTETTIRDYFFNTMQNKTQCRLYYDELDFKVYIMWGTTPNYFNRALVIDMRNGAKHPWEFEDQTGTKFIVGAFNIQGAINVSSSVGVVDGFTNRVVVNGDPVVTSDSVQDLAITTNLFFVHQFIDTAQFIQFGQFTQGTLLDFNNSVGFDTFIESGTLSEEQFSSEKKIPYLWTYFTENLDDSACTVKAKWDFSIDPLSNDQTTSAPVYVSQGPFRSINRTRVKLPGQGESLKIRYEGTPGKNFEILGFSLLWEIQ